MNFGPVTTKIWRWNRTRPYRRFWKTIFRPSEGAGPPYFYKC